jgi:hypothetical protein
MFAKVISRVRRRSAGQKSSTSPTQPQKAVIQVDIAPELLRWADFSTPFPSVSMGGYSRFYETHTHTTSEPTEPLLFCPLLSQQPDPSPSSEIPPQSLLFDALRPKCLPAIREVSMESLRLNFKPMNLTITTSTTQPRSLKRRQRQLLRTPSIQRDFALGRYPSSPSVATSITINNVSDDATPPSPRSIFSSDSSHSSHKRTDSNYSEFPITPATSIEDETPLALFLLDKLSHIESESESVMTSPISPSSCRTVKILPPGHESESVVTRPLSSISFSTARSDFSEI